jgi:hypothetical protein
MSETEKRSDDFQIEVVNQAFISESLETLPEFGSQEWTLAEKQLVRKLDVRILPTLSLVFIMNYIDVCFLSFLILKNSLFLMFSYSVMGLQPHD